MKQQGRKTSPTITRSELVRGSNEHDQEGGALRCVISRAEPPGRVLSGRLLLFFSYREKQKLEGAKTVGNITKLQHLTGLPANHLFCFLPFALTALVFSL